MQEPGYVTHPNRGRGLADFTLPAQGCCLIARISTTAETEGDGHDEHMISMTGTEAACDVPYTVYMTRPYTHDALYVASPRGIGDLADETDPKRLNGLSRKN